MGIIWKKYYNENALSVGIQWFGSQTVMSGI